MSNDSALPLDRITYRNGQLLTARDLNDEQQRHAGLWAAHNRHLHETWGIALGFKVQAMADNKGVVVGSGYGVDEAGRDILLSSSFGIAVPDVTGPEMFVLTAAYRENAAFQSRRDKSYLCSDAQDQSRERPSFQWQRPLEARFGLQLPLVAVTVAQGTIQGELNLRVRRNARPHNRPHVNFETTEAGRTGWKVWEADGGTNLGLEVEVDTAGAGFHNKPQYFAMLKGDFSNRAGEPPLTQGQGWPGEIEQTFSPGSLGFITAATAESFTYRLICAGQPPFIRSVMPSEAESRRWHLVWVGVEPVTGGEPALDLTKIILISVFL